jgi:hypothetical protein
MIQIIIEILKSVIQTIEKDIENIQYTVKKMKSLQGKLRLEGNKSFSQLENFQIKIILNPNPSQRSVLLV